MEAGMSSDRSSRSRPPESIGAILAKLLDDSHWGRQIRDLKTLSRWREIVGPRIAKHAQPESFKDGVLVIAVQNSIWLCHLRFLTAELQEKLNREIPSSPIKEIRFRLGRVEPSSGPGSGRSTPRTSG
jgi:predicted nucleic acid-binding Zn ribbon protein